MGKYGVSEYRQLYVMRAHTGALILCTHLHMHRPNVCTVTRTVVTHELEYRYRESCGYVYSHDYYQWIRQCK